MLLAAYLKRYKTLMLCSVFFFYVGCGVTLSLLRMDCAQATKSLLDRNKSNLNSNIEYAVLILSKPSNEYARETIRETWKNLAGNIIVENGERIYKWNKTVRNAKAPDFIKFYFVIGAQSLTAHDTMQLLAENENTDDLLLLENHYDDYKNLSEKMLMTMEWFSKNLNNLKYIIKTDDDSFVRIDLIIRDLEAYAPSMSAPEISEYVSYKANKLAPQGLYWGYFNGRARVYLTGKWKEEDWFLCNNYLPYALGGGYVISKEIVDYVGRNRDVLSTYNSEDVSMGVWTSALRGINRVHDIRFDTEWTSRGCSDDMFIRHKQNRSDMIKMYKNLLSSDGKKLCSSTNEKRKSYHYKWDVLPNSCCT